jgi:multiple sugar transport system permease protein
MSAVWVDPSSLPGETGMVERPRRRWLPFSPWHLVLMPIALVMLTPLWSMLATSFETLEQTRHFPPILWPGTFHLENYPHTLEAAAFPTWFWNTTVVT